MTTFHRFILVFLCIGSLALAGCANQVVVGTPPPPPEPPPYRVWVHAHWHYRPDGTAVWVPGRWRYD